MAWVFDLDGVIRLGPRPIPGAANAVARIREAGEEVAFVTNNSSHTIAEVRDELTSFGIVVDPHEIVTSATAVATLVAPGERVLACAGPGVVEALQLRGAEVVAEGPAEAVVVGFHVDFDYAAMARAASAIRSGARLLASNADAAYPTPDGLRPGAGAILAGIAVAGGVEPTAIAGKPHRPIADLVRARLGPVGVAVGDRPDTDGLFAVALGYDFALVLSGVTTTADLPVHPTPAFVADDLASAVEVWMASEPRQAQ